MGIQGLLPLLKKIHSPVNVSKFEGCTVAIDAYCWLHKGAFACADKLALGEKTDVYVYYCMKYLEYMLKKNVKPIMVFDGCRLPSKKDVEKSRREKREIYRKKAAQMLREGKRAEARECLQRCIDISPEMALELMKTCRARGIDCIVAPYEADAQLAFLCKQGIAQAIITEDSDLLLFGSQRVIFKMDHFGNGVLIESERLNEVLGISEGYYTFDKFRYMCIMSGCDYLPSLPGIGLGKASKVFKLARQTDLKVLLKKFPSTYLKMSMSVPQEYIDNFIKADNTFLYQLVFNPLTRKLGPLNPYPPEINREELHYAGPYIPADKALQIALGNINIYTMQMFAHFDPDKYVPPKAAKKTSGSLHQLSIWNKLYRVRPKFVDKETEEATRPNLQGKEQNCASKLQRKSPRKRPVEESKDTNSDTELSGMYQSTSPLKEESANRCQPEDMSVLSPRRKRARLHLASSFPEESEESDPGMEAEDTSTPQKGSSEDRVNFMASLKEAVTVVSVNTLTSPDNASPKDKENCLQSPKRNKFAVLTGKRPRFDINAKKELKSRYFSSSSDKDTTKPCTPSSEEGSVQVNQQQNCKIKQNSPVTKTQLMSPESKVKLQSPVKKTKVGLQDKVKASPGSAFSWSKFKFTKQAEKQSPKVNSQFKQIVCNKPGTKNFIQKSLSSSELLLSSGDDVIIKDVSASQPKTSCHGNSSQDSQGVAACDHDLHSTCNSVCGSIDSFCLVDSQSSQDTKPSLPSLTSTYSDTKDSQSSQDTKQSLPSLTSTHSDNTEEESQISTTSVSSPALLRRSLGGVTKSACRVSGLSRGQKTKTNASKSKAPDMKQRSIKDLFSKFSHNRSVTQLSHSEKIVIKEEDEQAMTPSSDNKVLSTMGGVQRKLLT
ncbi:exonuclease 1-like [Pecten maximus]|uniref:exonuclease 1-like n=1 Tax=Pecten maximus TaxID=6579 RepID=UPI001458D22E|nr:exonuclease 1-like [Pecten maximus]